MIAYLKNIVTNEFDYVKLLSVRENEQERIIVVCNHGKEYTYKYPKSHSEKEILQKHNWKRLTAIEALTEKSKLAKIKKIKVVDIEMFYNIESIKRDVEYAVVGDFVELKNGSIERIAHVWSTNEFQFESGIGNFNLNKSGSCSMSGSLNQSVVMNLKKLEKTHKGKCWIFSEGKANRGNSVYHKIEFNLFKEI